MSDKIVIGTCSICSGPVYVLKNWMGTQPQVPSCSNCGATSKNPYGPTIPMEKPVTPKKVMDSLIKSTVNINGKKVPREHLFLCEFPGETEIVDLAGGGWGLVIKDSIPNVK